MVRSAAKNYKDVAVLTNSHQYGIYLDSIKGNISIKPETLRKQFMIEAFKHTAEYDATISDWMSENV
jgi:phosphoribosylaminoimidazolecarboxamide formyltransferase/IMP cyclohydrolase